MLIRPTPGTEAVPATAHGVLAAVVSMILGVGAHSLGGSHIPTAAQTVLLLGLALGVGLVRGRQVRSVEADRIRGRVRIGWVGALATLSVGQAGAHLVLSLIDGHGAHGAAESIPGPAMLFWHIVAVPAAGAILFLAERLSRACSGRLDLARLLVDAPVSAPATVVGRRTDRRDDRLHPEPMSTASGVRGPPCPV
ncbi:hypothetical protein [Gordonia shandongensis]|uniref:hypothetical protein n=1 Tax=Gordonia shandongensis TaxID=376351 RepID=UPI0003FFC2CB|nr:hypothetical protein [Gordonia shandongensis]